MSLAIRLDELAKNYRGTWSARPTQALRGVSLAIETGEAFGFIGPNGAGKSTTIKILMGLIRANSGIAELFGRNVLDPRARRGVGYVPESPYLQDCLTPAEILEMSARLHGALGTDFPVRCQYWLERLELGTVAKKAVRTFSKGMTQRVALAQALCIQPRLLILDEPLSGLDPVGRRNVVDMLSEYKRSGGTLFFTSHVLHDVERLADRFGMIHGGLLRAVRSPAELAGEEQLVTVMTFGSVAVPGMREDFAGRWTGEVARGDLWSLLRSLEGAGHTLVELRSTLSLEAAFLRALREDVEPLVGG